MNASLTELLTRGVTEIIGREELEKKLAAGEKLRIKLGIDPTSPNLHIGRAIPLLKLRDFQQLGHQVVFIVGDFTAVIGDTSDKDSERPMLPREVIEENKKTYFDQVGKLIDLSKAELHSNSEWLGALSYREIGEQADAFSVADFIARENIAKRLKEGKRVSLREVLYPLMQGYDSVAIKADVELGGTDQRFNLLAGRTLQERAGQSPQAMIMNPLINGLDGRKMSSSWGNVIPLVASPQEMYGLVMSMRDEEIKTYFEFCTRVPLNEVEEIIKGHPKEAKMRLARELVTMYHDSAKAAAAEADFVETFSNKGTPKDIQTISCPAGTKISDLLLEHGLVESKSDFSRLLKSGAIKAGETILSEDLKLKEGVTLKVGKHRFVRIECL